MKKVSVYYLDDNEKNIEYFISLTEHHNNVEMLGYSNDYKKALNDIKEMKPDIVVIDIEMPDVNGFQFADIIQSICPHIVFLTCHTEFAVEAFKFDPLHYLIKPIGSVDLGTIIQRFQKRQYLGASNEVLPQKNKDQVIVNTLKSFEFINCADIVFIQSVEGYSHFYTVNEEQKIISSKNLKHYETDLISNNDFHRIHKSFIINKKMLKQIVKESNTSFRFIFKDNRNFTVASFNKEKWIDNYVT